MMSGAFEIEGGGGQQNKPVQAYVVNDDITNSQDTISRIRRRSTI
jgi:hypothetical protein